jgi:histidinol-phosphate phosphatase family protein
MSQKVVFLDRDGVINRGFEDGYVDRWRKLTFLPRSLKALRRLRQARYKVIVISNQAGVSRGIYSRKTLREITRRMRRIVREKGGRLDAVYYCPHLPEDRCRCRKPKTALFRKAKRRFGIRLKEAFFVGDSRVDVEAGKAIGCRTILVLSGRNKRRPRWEVKPDAVRKDLWDAVNWILKKET